MILTVCANPSVDSFWSIEQIVKGTVNRSQKEFFFPGGKGIHTAFALKELGSNVTSLGVWGGQTGKWLIQKCKDNDIKTIGPIIKQWTRLCITLKSSVDWNETELLGAGPEVDSDDRKNFLNTYKKFLQNNEPQAVLISGSIPRGFSENLYQTLVSIAVQSGIPSFIDATGSLLRHSLKANPFVVHVNKEEGKSLCGESNPVDIARFLNNYCTIAAVTAGADGLFLLSNNKLFHAYHELDLAEVKSTIGSGDCLLAGLCMAIMKSDDQKYWATYAVACGSANCVHPELGILKAKDVEAFLPQIIVKTI